MKKPRPAVRATVFVDRFRLMAVGVFLFFVLGGVLAPSAAKAVSFDFTVVVDSSICLYCSGGTLHFTYDDADNQPNVSWDVKNLSGNQVTTNVPYLGIYNSFDLVVYQNFNSSTGTFETFDYLHGHSSGQTCPTCELTIQIFQPPHDSKTMFFILFGETPFIRGENQRWNSPCACMTNIPFPPARVPEPTPLLFMASGFFGLAGARWRQFRQERTRVE